MTTKPSSNDTPAIADAPPEEVLSTFDASGRRRWLYPVVSKGRYYWCRLGLAGFLIGLFLALPIVEIGGNPAVFLDVAHREFHFFGLTLYPTDTILLMLFLLLSLLGVFLMTALLGRVWCGWGCPQTVYMEFVFRPIERFFEGKESTRKRRDAGPWTFDKAWRKAGKHGVYIVLALALAHAFLAYFVSWDSLLAWMGGAPTAQWGVFVAMLIVSGLVYFDFAFFREQMCTIACPYARLQSVLQDRDSMIVSYDPNRGEPRGRRNREQRKLEQKGIDIPLGDCIDCGACVRTCPTGIDIRDGLQMECIACTQCIDACDDIMTKIDKPLGLIRYTSENAIEESKKLKIIRPRVILYTVLWVGLLTAFITLLSTRDLIEVNVGRAVGAPFAVLKDDQVANRVRFRVRNRTGEAESFHIEAVSPANLQVKPVGPATFELDTGQMQRVEAWVVAPREIFAGGEAGAKFAVVAGDGQRREVDFTLAGPLSP